MIRTALILATLVAAVPALASSSAPPRQKKMASPLAIAAAQEYKRTGVWPAWAITSVKTRQPRTNHPAQTQNAPHVGAPALRSPVPPPVGAPALRSNAPPRPGAPVVRQR